MANLQAARVAVISLHTSPFAQPGTADSGGMNVYVRELAYAMAHAGYDSTIYVRRTSPLEPPEAEVEEGVRVVFIPAGPLDLAKEELPEVIDEFSHRVLQDIASRGGTDVLHAHYWLSGMAGHKLKHELDCPLVTNFHTLARAKWDDELTELEIQERGEEEQTVIDCSDIVIVSCEPEKEEIMLHYDIEDSRIAIVPPGVEHAFFSPGDMSSARGAIGLAADPASPGNPDPDPSPATLLFVGRITRLKNPSLAAETLACLPEARLIMVGGPSGQSGQTEMRAVQDLAKRLGIQDRISFVPPRSHRALSSYYRAADAVLIPSRSESFGLVALEAAACGTPVVAASVGGLRSLVKHGETGFLVPEAEPELYAALVSEIIEDRHWAAEMSMNAAELASQYSWEGAAASLSSAYDESLKAGVLDCLV